MNPTTHETRPAPPRAGAVPRQLSGSAVRVFWLALALVAFVAAGGMAATAAVVHHFDDGHRHGGYLTTDTVHASSEGYAVVFDDIDLDGLSGDWLLGTARLRATGTDPDSPVFIGVATSADVDTYLQGVGYSTVDDIDGGAVTYDQHAGGPPAVAPGDSDVWIVSEGGPGTQTVTWKPEEGSWAVVVMNQDAASGVAIEADLGATLPVLPSVVHWLVAGSGVCGAIAVTIVVLVFRRRRVGRR